MTSQLFSRRFLKVQVHLYFKVCNQGYASEKKYLIEKQYKLHKLDVGPETKVEITKGDAIKYFTQMTTIRKLENVLANLYKDREVRGFCHLYAGQEACGVGLKAAMQNKDTIITSYRSHGWTYLQGVTPYAIIAELMGRVSGCSKGKGGSMHTYAPNFFGGNGIVGAQVPVGAGSAFAHKYSNSGGICFTLYGDGASNQGQVFESYNLSKLLNLPVVFICENNKYGMGTAAHRSSGTTDYYTRGHYLPGIWVDGMDVLAVREATRFAIAHILANKGPLVMEFETYRYFGHSMSDPGTSYRSRDEVQKARKLRDPISKFRDKMIELGVIKESEFKDADKKITNEIDDAVKKSKSDPVPNLDQLTCDVYLKSIEKKVRGISSFAKHDHKVTGTLIKKQVN